MKVNMSVKPLYIPSILTSKVGYVYRENGKARTRTFALSRRLWV